MTLQSIWMPHNTQKSPYRYLNRYELMIWCVYIYNMYCICSLSLFSIEGFFFKSDSNTRFIGVIGKNKWIIRFIFSRLDLAGHFCNRTKHFSHWIEHMACACVRAYIRMYIIYILYKEEERYRDKSVICRCVKRAQPKKTFARIKNLIIPVSEEEEEEG